MKIRDESYAIDRCWSNLDWKSTAERYGEGAGYLHGTIKTPHGIVSAYAQRGDRDLSQIEFVYRGRSYRRYFEGKFYTARGLSIIACRFARSIVEQ